MFNQLNYSTFDENKLSLGNCIDKFYVKQYPILYDGEPLTIISPVSEFPYGVSKDKFNQPQTTLKTTNLPFMKLIRKVERAINLLIRSKDITFLHNNKIYIHIDNKTQIKVNSLNNVQASSSSSSSSGIAEFTIPHVSRSKDRSCSSCKVVCKKLELL